MKKPAPCSPATGESPREATETLNRKNDPAQSKKLTKTYGAECSQLHPLWKR